MTLGYDRVRTAKKEHKCYLCGEIIPIGERYHPRAGVNYGDFWFILMHGECEKETHHWDQGDWESFEEGELTRPTK